MASRDTGIAVFLEAGKKKTFAGAVRWPGWCRWGGDEASALAALAESAPRYARALTDVGLDAPAAADPASFEIVERLEGNATTDFGAPAAVPASDAQAVDGAELERLQALLRASWRAFDGACARAAGRELLKGPRGGGRDLEGIARHVLEAEAGYLSRLGWKPAGAPTDDPAEAMERVRRAALEGLAASARGELPDRGPRGGIRWKPRTFVRRVAWHALDHAWEIEDRTV